VILLAVTSFVLIFPPFAVLWLVCALYVARRIWRGHGTL